MTGRRTILIIDQERMLVDLLIRELCNDAVRVLSSDSVPNGRTLIDQLHPDLLILDPGLPGSLELLRDIQTTDQQVAVILLTHSAHIGEKLGVLSAVAVVDRSQGFEILFDTIRSLIELEGPLNAERTHVLVVDDDEDMRNMLSSAFEQWGYSVTTAADGDQALEAVAHNQNLSLVLLDLRIPGKGGMEVLKEIKTHNPELGIIMLTAISDREIANQARALGAFDYLVKPVSLPHLETLVIACLSHKEYLARPWWKRG